MPFSFHFVISTGSLSLYSVFTIKSAEREGSEKRPLCVCQANDGDLTLLLNSVCLDLSKVNKRMSHLESTRNQMVLCVIVFL